MQEMNLPAKKYYIEMLYTKVMSVLNYTERVESVRARIAAACARAGREPEAVTMIAVTKYVGAAETRSLIEAGIHDLGENRVKTAVEKITQITVPSIRWHFIGNLQTNKVKDVLPYVSMLHSLDRYSLAKELQRQCEKFGRSIDCLVQVNVSGEQTKSGMRPDEVKGFLDDIREFDLIHVKGLMTMAPLTESAEDTRPIFKNLRQLRDDLRESYSGLEQLSMGMSADFEVAVEEGATLIRVGSILVKS